MRWSPERASDTEITRVMDYSFPGLAQVGPMVVVTTP